MRRENEEFHDFLGFFDHEVRILETAVSSSFMAGPPFAYWQDHVKFDILN